MRKLQISRRAVLAGATATAAATVVAFDPVNVGWLTEAEAETDPAAIRVPGLDGELVVDEESRTEAADDYGHIVHRMPVAVLRPGSVRDIATVIRFANHHGLKVATRGQGHSTFGQAQAGGGIVIDSRTLATIHRVGTGHAVVDAGVQWLDLIKATLAQGQTPPVATDYLGLSIGGTLSVGGIGGATSHHGLLVDNVLALEVVTGTGEIVRCTPSIRPALFHAVLGGLGQFAVIARATVRLIPAESTARVYHLSYPDLTSMTAAQRKALSDRRFSYLEGQITPTETGWTYVLEGVQYYTPPAEPDDQALIADLAPAGTEITDMPYFAWLNRIYDLVQQLMALRLPGPWINVFIPDEATDAYVASVLAETTPADAGGVILLYPVRNDVIRQPFVRLPDSPVVFLLALLRAVSPPDDAQTQRLIDVNRAQYDRVVAVGGTHYPVGAIELTEADWQRHYGPEWPAFRAAKHTHDPNNVLTPGQAIFG
ncbi:MAG: FAD-binding protein [Actinomycetota bacterium]|nr:FAD-binding protein [Actinomycetota bacterium]